MSNLDFRFDPTTKAFVKVTEAVTTEEELRAELQAEADTAQNELNDAHAAKEQSVAALVEAREQDELKAAEVVAAEEKVKFSTARLGDLDEAVRVQQDLAGAAPESEFAEDAGDGATDEATESESVDVPVHTAESAPA